MRKKKIIKSLSKKFIIKGVATTLVVLLPFSFIKPRETKAIVGVDDALLLAGASILAVGGVGAYMGLKNSDLAEKLASNVSDNISQFGTSAKNIYNNLAFGYNVANMLPTLLSAYGEHLEGIEGIEQESVPVENGECYDYYYSVGDVFQGVATRDSRISLYVEPFLKDVERTDNMTTSFSYKKGDTVKLTLRYAHDTSYKPYYPECYMLVGFKNGVQQTYGYVYLNKVCSKFKYSISKEDFKQVQYFSKIVEPLPTITDVDTKSYPTTISLSKDKVQEYVGEYVEQNPNDNDNKPDYSQLIPFMFNLLEKDLGNGEITPQNLINSGICSYVYPDSTSHGYYPYYISNESDTPSGDNVNSNVNVTVNNNLNPEVTEEEKNGILNILDNGVRKTTTLLSNLKNSMTGLGNTLQGLFNFLPEPVGYLFYSALCLSLIFFILSLRR